MNPTVEELQAEVAWMDERVNLVRDLAKKGLAGELDMQTALATIVQQLAGVSRPTSAKP